MTEFRICMIFLVIPFVCAFGPGKLTVPSFGIKFVGNAFRIYRDIPWIDCIEHCKAIRKCQRVNYYSRMVGLCELCEGTEDAVIEPTEGVLVSSKSDWEYNEPQLCQTCGDSEMCSTQLEQTCRIDSCPQPYAVTGAKMLGNLNHIGARRLYVCSNRERRQVTCLQNGTWSNMANINCVCSRRNIDHSSFRITESDSGIEVIIICDPGYKLLGPNRTHCDETTQTWTASVHIACVKLHNDPWVLVYGKTQGASGNIFYSWTKDATDNRDYRDNTFLDSWMERNVQQVKVDIIDFSDNVAVELLFDGRNTGLNSWFSKEKLVESTYKDLTSERVDIFSIPGLKLSVGDEQPWIQNGRSVIRWAITNYDSQTNTIDCSRNKVWLVIMHGDFHPCEDVGFQEHILLFSDSENGTTWNGGHLVRAKMMLVYVQTS